MKNDIEFVEDTHTYLYNGVIIPSVSELIRFKFPDAYKGIPTKILKQKASYGTKTHQMIEDFIKGVHTIEDIQKKKIDPNIKVAVEQFEELRKKWIFNIQEIERIVCYEGKYAGTYDLKTADGLIIDLKTTTEIHHDWLRWQLGLYYLADNNKQNYGYVMWFPKGKKAKVEQIEVASFDECIELVKEYEKHSSEQ